MGASTYVMRSAAAGVMSLVWLGAMFTPAAADGVVDVVPYQVVPNPVPYPGGFQSHVAFDDDLLLVSTNTSAGFPGSGAAIVYQNGPSGWQPAATFQPAGRVPSDLFGERVDIDGDVAVVGAPGENNNGG